MSSIEANSALVGDFSTRLVSARNWALVATAFTLPLSTSAQAVTVGIFILLALPTVGRGAWLTTLSKPAGMIPTLLFLLILVSIFWSPDPFGAGGMTNYAKLLLIPLIMASAITPRLALQIGFGFLAGCSIILVLSWGALLWPTGPWAWFKYPGVPVKDNAVQSACFALCAFGLAIGAIREWSARKRKRAVVMAALALLFFVNIFVIHVSKTGLLMAIALLGLFLLRVGGWRRGLLIAVPAFLVIAIAVWASAPAQKRLAEFLSDMQAVKSSEETVSTAARLDFWSKALSFIKEAPLLGHGAGSIKPLYQSLEATRPSPYGEATPDPHNQFFAIAIQVGLIGAALLLAMWVAHFVMFAGQDFFGALGQAVVLQNVVGSLFNSHLSTVTQGTLYCLAVGLLGAVMGNLSPVGANVSAFGAGISARRTAAAVAAVHGPSGQVNS